MRASDSDPKKQIFNFPLQSPLKNPDPSFGSVQLNSPAMAFDRRN